MKRKVAKLKSTKGRVRPLVCGLMSALAVALLPSASYSESPRIETITADATQQISMGIGKSVIVDLPQDAAEIFIGNPKVANAIVRSARKLYIIGMQEGQTTVFALDGAGRQFARLEISIGADVGNLEQILKEAMPTASITTRTVGNAIILSGLVDSAEDAQRAMDIAQAFVKPADANVSQSTGSLAGSATGSPGSVAGQVSGTSSTMSQVRHDQVINSLVIRGRDQVMLKVSVAEIRRDIAKQLGLTSSTWGAFTQYNPFAINGNIATNPSTNLPTQLTLSSPGNTVNATLQAYERYGVSRILAEPTVTAISGENAKFTVGGQIPVPSSPVCATNGTVTNCSPGGVTYQAYGVTLNFSPVVLSAGRILLHIATEVTELDYQTSAVIQNVSVPGLRTRKNETTVEVPSGGSIASAGFLQTSTQQVINGLPGAMNLPILGALFRSRDYQRNETELMIIITPYLMKATSANLLPKPDDGFADSSDPQAWLLGRINRLYASPNNPEALKNFNGRIGFIQD